MALKDPYERSHRRRRRLGITEADYQKMFEDQGGVCAICGKAPKVYSLAVDHNHKTREIRGLLCQRCNWALGWLEVHLSSIKKYWKRYANASTE